MTPSAEETQLARIPAIVEEIMKTLATLVLAVAAALVFALPAHADEILLHDGHTMTGTIEKVTADGITLKMLPKGGGTAVVTVPAGHLDPHYFYAMRDQALGNDVKGRLDLSVWAYEHGLFRRAKAQLTKAREMNPEMAKQFYDQILPGLRDGIAEQMVEAAKQCMTGGHLDEAKTILSKVITQMGDTTAATQAQTLVPVLQQKIGKKNAARQARETFVADEQARETADQRKKFLEPAEALVRQGHRIETKALTAEHQTPALEEFKQAAIEFEKALRHLDELAKNHGGDAVLMTRVGSLREDARKSWIQAHSSSAHIYISRGDFHDAQKEIEAIRKFDPEAAQVAQLQTDLDNVKNEDHWGYYWRGWGPRGGGLGRPGGLRR